MPERRLAWFAPLPPVRSGIAAYNAELLPHLAETYRIDVFVDRTHASTGDPVRQASPSWAAARAASPPDPFGAPSPHLSVRDAHDFVWAHAVHPYDLIVYQLGNERCHDYMWPYLVRWPGLVVLHDGQLHHARARCLLARRRLDHYRDELRFSHPDATPGAAEVGALGLLGSLQYIWPMLRVPVTAARLVAVHSAWLAEDLREAFREARVETIRMGVADPLGARPPHAVAQERARLRARYGIPESAVLFVAFGRVTPEKRIGPAMRALAALAGRGIDVRLLLAGDVADHYALDRDLARSGARQRVAIAGHVPDEEVPAVLAAADVCLALRWPTARETSASWLRAVAAGKPTVVTDLAHTVDVPALDPRDWSVQPAARPQAGPAELSSAVVPAGGDPDGGDRLPPDRPDAWPADEPVAVAIDILDEDHSLALALERLATDADLRARLGASARRYFERGHTIAHMVADYRRVIARARDDGRWPEAAALAKLPRHLLVDGAARARAILAEVGVAVDFLDW